MVGGHCHPQVGGTHGRWGGIGVWSLSLVEGGGSESSLSSLIVGSWCRSQFSTLRWTVGMLHQEFSGGTISMDNLVSYDWSCRMDSSLNGRVGAQMEG